MRNFCPIFAIFAALPVTATLAVAQAENRAPPLPTPIAAPVTTGALADKTPPVAPPFAGPVQGDAEWSSPGRDSALTRYSTLGDINVSNVKNLRN
ncbi:MAG TPA: hypothetical protein VNR51_04265, partial [Hyphomicrobium sp.]|nr:hypothetical protein [Hyphomicrobium sp.]